MKYIIILITLFSVCSEPFNSSAQISPISLIELGTGLSNGIGLKVKDGKKRKAIEKSISEIEINGQSIKRLRVPAEKIISNAKINILALQNQLDNFQNDYKKAEHLELSYSTDEIATIRTLDNSWPVEYYTNELKEYQKYERNLTQKERLLKDSIESAKRAGQKRTHDSIILAQKKYNDSILYLDRTKGYLFVNKEFVLLKDKPSDKAQTIGKIYLGSYLKLLGYGDNSLYTKISLEDIIGYVSRKDLVDTIDKITVLNADIATYKSRKYYKYEPNYDYREEPPVSAPSASSNNTSSTKHAITQKKSYNQSVRYIRGPRGGCYYISGGSKIYVDRSYCN